MNEERVPTLAEAQALASEWLDRREAEAREEPAAKPEPKPQTRGWSGPGDGNPWAQSRRAHYFVGADTLCGFWHRPDEAGPLDAEPKGEPCAKCLRLLGLAPTP